MQLIPGSRAPFSIDLVSIAILLVIPLLIFSLYQVKVKKNYLAHKRIQCWLSAAILVVLIIFEIEIRFFGWRQYAVMSPFFDTILMPFLYFHIAIATTATVLWTLALVQGLKKAPEKLGPGSFSARHRKLGWAATFFMCLTSITGWTFFLMAFWI